MLPRWLYRVIERQVGDGAPQSPLRLRSKPRGGIGGGIGPAGAWQLRRSRT